MFSQLFNSARRVISVVYIEFPGSDATQHERTQYEGEADQGVD